jgi:hypothetical protein
MSESHGKKDPLKQLIDSAPLPQFPYVPRATQAPDNPVAATDKCEACDGKGGWVTSERTDPVSGREQEIERCGDCEGTGRFAAPLPAAPAPTVEAALQALVDQAQELNMGYGAPTVEPVARLMLWEAPKHFPVPHGGVCARTFVEFPKGAGDVGYWKEGEPLFTRAALAARQAPTEAAKEIHQVGFRDELNPKLIRWLDVSEKYLSGLTPDVSRIVYTLAARQVGAPDASIAQGAGSDAEAEADGTQAMADCMDMVRRELVEAGIIDASIAPMFVADAVLAHIARLARTAAPSEPTHPAKCLCDDCRKARRPNPANGAPKPPGHNPVA